MQRHVAMQEEVDNAEGRGRLVGLLSAETIMTHRFAPSDMLPPTNDVGKHLVIIIIIIILTHL